MIPDIWVDSSFARFANSDDADAFAAQHGGRPRRPTPAQMTKLRDITELALAGKPRWRA
jgi:hypothetical protein